MTASPDDGQSDVARGRRAVLVLRLAPVNRADEDIFVSTVVTEAARLCRSSRCLKKLIHCHHLAIQNDQSELRLYDNETLEKARRADNARSNEEIYHKAYFARPARAITKITRDDSAIDAWRRTKMTLDAMSASAWCE